MEADKILRLVEYEFCHRCFIIDIIVSDNYSTTQYMIKHTSIVTCVQVIKIPKGNIYDEISVPSTSHTPPI